ncbi:MAP kinase-activating death domain protein [Taenia crassiceps]|uniref:MAP kinase-activating death domain protein n=1 Tax=Taenia crassiceps TaxID=6207 RepID=A0ABR4QKI0_9CEST
MIDCLPGFGRLIGGQSWNLENFWDLFLYGEWDDQNITNAEALIAIQLERWILRLLSTPAPVPGCTFINLKLLPEEVENPLIFAMPDKSRLSLVDFSFYLPMELLSIANCLQVILAILLEQKVLVKSRDYNALTMCVLALTKMLYPLQYMFPVIPLLPTSLPNAEQILLSPTPFLIGIPSSFLGEKGQHVPMSEILLVDLDSGQLTYGSSLQRLPDFPTQEKNNLCNQLLRALELMKKGTNLSPDAVINLITRPQRSTIDDPESGASDSAGTTGHTAPVDVDVIDVATRVAMVRFLNSPGILGDFTEHTRTLRLFPRPVVTFQYVSFMRSRPAIYPFTQKLAKTQAVEYLSEWCLYPENEVYQRIHAGIFDPLLIGDKPKWFCSELVPVDFKVYADSDTCVIHLGCCKNRNPWAVENVHLEPWLREKVSVELLRRNDSSDQPQCARSLLVNYREFFSAPRGVEEAIAFARAIREREVSVRKGRRPSASLLAHTTAPSYSEDTSDDVLSSSLSESDDDSDKDDFDIWDLKWSLSTNPAEATEVPSANSMEKTISVGSKSTHEKPASNGSVNRPQGVKLGGLMRKGSFPWSSETDDGAGRRLNREANVDELDLRAHIFTNLSDAFSGANNIFSKILTQPHNIIQKSREFIQSPKLPRRIDSASKTTADDQAKKTSKKLKLPSNQDKRRKIALSRLTWSSFDENSSEKQEVLKQLTQAIWSGDKVGLRTKHEVQGLMDDERYRTYVLVKLLNESHEFHYEPESHVPNVALQDILMFRYLVWLTKAVICGYERNWLNRGIHGVGSAFLLLELAHTHFWDQSIALEHELKASKQRPASVQGSKEDLFTTKLKRNPLESLSSLIKTTAAELRRNSLVGGSAADGLQVSLSRRSSRDQQSEGVSTSASGSPTTSPMWPRVRVSDSNSSTPNPNSLFGREVVMDNATEFKCRSSGVNRYTHAQLLRCTVSQTDLRSRHQPRYYIFEALIGAKERSRIWDQAQFWEDAFLDAAARERDLLGLDHSPTALLERYAKLSVPERKLWDLKEDRILAALLHNLIAFMLMLKTAKQEIYNVGYRLLGRCRLGSHFSHSISSLLESIAELSGNAVDLIPSMSASIYQQAFIVTTDAKNVTHGTASILEIYDCSYLLRGLSGAIEIIGSLSNVLAVILFPKGKTCVLLEVIEDRVAATQMRCKKAKALSHAIEKAMAGMAFQAKPIANPIQFCTKLASNPDEIRKNLGSLGVAEGVAFSKPTDAAGKHRLADRIYSVRH